MTQDRLLILDDDPMIGQTIRSIAEPAGFATRVTTTADRFFVEFESWTPTHIALDLIMPDMDGVEVLGELARRACKARIIITSGVGSRVLDAAGRSATEHGLSIAGVIPKPFSPARLRNMLLGEAPTDQAAVKASSGVDLVETSDQISAEALRRGLENGELELVYQPKIHCLDDHLTGFEALVRWNCPERGMLSPDRFIPVAESSGLIVELTRQVIEQAMRWFGESFVGIEDTGSLDRQSIRYIRQLTLSINLTARSLEDPAFMEFVTDQCQRNGIRPEQVILELTETSAMQDPVASLDVLTRLRVKGFQLSIDDFGTGYSSMLLLVRLPFSEIKVDKSFVMVAMHSEEARAVIRSIVELGHSLGLVVTAEGVEDLETFDYLSQIGCERAQGYFFSRPVDGDRARMWARDHLKSWRQSALE